MYLLLFLMPLKAAQFHKSWRKFSEMLLKDFLNWMFSVWVILNALSHLNVRTHTRAYRYQYQTNGSPFITLLKFNAWPLISVSLRAWMTLFITLKLIQSHKNLYFAMNGDWYINRMFTMVEHLAFNLVALHCIVCIFCRIVGQYSSL